MISYLLLKKVTYFLLTIFSLLSINMLFSTETLANLQANTSYTNSLTIDFSTYFGGQLGEEVGRSITITKDNSFLITGDTSSSDFPTLNAYDSSLGGNSDGIIAKFSNTGSLLWSTFLGGNDSDHGYAIAVAGDGCSYITGDTKSSNFPIKDAFDNTYGGNWDIFIAKFSKKGSLLWSTYLGGKEIEYCGGIAVASDGSCYVTGATKSDDFPTLNAYNDTIGALDVYVTKFSADGELLWSTYLGGDLNDGGNSIAVGKDGSCYVTGWTHSIDFPTLNAFDSTSNGFMDGFVSKFSSNGDLLWSTYLGGDYWDEPRDIAVSSEGSCYITGFTSSSEFPTKDAFDNSPNGNDDAFVTKFSPTGELLWSTYLGGSEQEWGYGIAIANDDNCCVTGETSSINFPILQAFNSTIGSSQDIFVSKFATNGSLLWSSFLGGDSYETGFGIASIGNDYYITGRTKSSDFPTFNAFSNTLGGLGDAFVTKIIEPTNPKYGYFAFLVVIPVIVIPIIIIVKRKR
ncbi:MAG: hypothetical protein FK734_17310 [Asgard group archaeon]|nr:hypothetical protein [Asgard group archaeon]